MLKLIRFSVLTAAVLLLGCDKPAGTEASAPLKVYRHAMDGAPGSFDPAQAASIYANFVVVNLYDTLYRYKYLARPYQLHPNLAAALPEVSDDGLVVTIPIKEGVHFIDDEAFEGGVGRELKATDFVYSIKRHFDPGTRAQGAWLWQNRIAGLDEWKQNGSDYDVEIEGLRALDDYTIQIILTRPFPQLKHTFTTGYSAVVAREAVEEYGKRLASHPVGSGPFMQVSRDNVRAVLEKNPDFRKEPFSLAEEGYDKAAQQQLGIEQIEGRSPPFVDQLIVEFIKEPAARWNALVAGEADFIKAPVGQFDTILKQRSPLRLNPELAEKYHFEAHPEAGFVYTNFNMADERIGNHSDAQQNERNRALRCAMVKSYDWKKSNQTFFYDIGRVFPGVIPPMVPEYDAAADTSYIQRDLEGARALLEEHGWSAATLPTLEYGFPNSVSERQAFEQFRNFMMEAGYPSEKLQPMIFATYGDYQRAYSQGKVTLINSSWTMDYPDTENLVQLYYGPNAAPGSNSANYDNPRYNELYELASVMTESPERSQIYRQMNQLLMDDCVSISGISRTLLFLWNKNVIMKPDRSFLGGYFLRFVDIAEPSTQPE